MSLKKVSILFLFLLFISCHSDSRQYLKIQHLEEVTISELHDGFFNEEFTIEDVVRYYLDRIERLDQTGPALNSMIFINPNALDEARILDNELREGTLRGSLHGIPVVLKDNINTSDMPTTAGSRFMEGSVPSRDAFIVEKLREKGAVIIGKTNLSEWANFHSSFSSSGWSGLGGQTKNPYDLTRNPCGSSSGSAVAVSANLAAIAIGTETNGSIVCPSNSNGVIGMKPTVGLWSRSGIIPISYTTDSAGPMTRTVEDAAILLGALAGSDSSDGLSAESDQRKHNDYTRFLNENGLFGKRIGFNTSPLGNHFRVDSLMHRAVEFFKNNGATIIDIDRISEENIGGDAFQVLLYEFKDGLNRYFETLGDDSPVRDIDHLAELIRSDPIETQSFDRDLIFTAAEKGGLDSDEYQQALERMLTHSRELGIDRVMNDHNLDAIISPTGSPAWKTDPVLGDNFKLGSSSPSARAGYPIITLPMGQIDGLPVGLSIFGRAWSEPVLLEIAYAFEQGTLQRTVPQFSE